MRSGQRETEKNKKRKRKSVRERSKDKEFERDERWRETEKVGYYNIFYLRSSAF